MMAFPLKAIAPAAAKSKPDSEERLDVVIGTSLFPHKLSNFHKIAKKVFTRHASD